MKKLTKKQLENQLKYERIYFLIMIVSCFIMMLGMTTNFTVMMANNGKMPVKWDINFTDDTHFTYQNESEIPYHYYSDIYNIFNGIFSLGDLLMFFAVTIIIGLAIYMVYILIKDIRIYYINNKNKKNHGKKK